MVLGAFAREGLPGVLGAAEEGADLGEPIIKIAGVPLDDSTWPFAAASSTAFVKSLCAGEEAREVPDRGFGDGGGGSEAGVAGKV